MDRTQCFINKVEYANCISFEWVSLFLYRFLQSIKLRLMLWLPFRRGSLCCFVTDLLDFNIKVREFKL